MTVRDDSALSLLIGSGLPTGTGIIAGTIDHIARFDEATGALVPITNGVIPAGSTIRVAGWAADTVAKGPVAGVCLRIGDVLADAYYGERRDDVADVHGVQGFARTGFHGYVTVDRAARGTLEVLALAVSADAESSAELGGKTSLTVLAGDVGTMITSERRAASAEVHVDAWAIGSAAEISVNGPLLVPLGAVITVRGWARDAGTNLPATAVFAVVDHEVVVRGNAWQPRPDVAAASQRDALVASGFTIRVDTFALAPGWHSFQIGIRTSDGEAHDVDERRFAFAVLPTQR